MKEFSHFFINLQHEQLFFLSTCVTFEPVHQKKEEESYKGKEQKKRLHFLITSGLDRKEIN